MGMYCNANTTGTGDDTVATAHYSISKGDLVIQVYPNITTTNHTYNNNSASSGSSSTAERASVPTGEHDLGAFSDLILSILAHELVTGYVWDTPTGTSSSCICTNSSSQHTIPSTIPTTTTTTSRSSNNIHSKLSLYNNEFSPPLYQVVYRQPSHHYTILQFLRPIAHTLYTYLPVIYKPVSTTTALLNTTNITNPTHVSNFRVCPENISFLISTRKDEENEESLSLVNRWQHSSNSDSSNSDDDARYFSDGL